MASKGMIIGVLVLVVAIGYIAMNPDVLQSASITEGTVLGNANEDPNVAKTQAYKGPVDVNSRSSDSIVSSTTYADATNYVVNYYKKVNDTPVFIIASGSNTAPIDVEANDKTIWAEVHIPSGQAFYVDGKSISDSHVRVGNPIVGDWNNDNVDTYIFPIDVTGYERQDDNPGFTWFVRLLDEGSIALTAPADLTALGQGKVSCSIDWEASIDNEGDAEFLTKAVLTLNQTESTDLWFPQDSWTKINGEKFTFDEDGFDGADKASTYTYTLKLANDYLTQWQSMNDKGAIPLKFLVNGDNEFDFETKIFTNFDADNEGILLTLALTTENAQGTATTVSDAVKCVEQ
jgi:hypothetical protein